MSDDAPGVFARGDDGRVQRVHLYHGGDYGLEDVAEVFLLGKAHVDAQENVYLQLSRHELGQLKAMADAYSFDHEPGFIDMCLDIVRFGDGTAEDPLRLHADF